MSARTKHRQEAETVLSKHCDDPFDEKNTSKKELEKMAAKLAIEYKGKTRRQLCKAIRDAIKVKNGLAVPAAGGAPGTALLPGSSAGSGLAKLAAEIASGTKSDREKRYLLRDLERETRRAKRQIEESESDSESDSGSDYDSDDDGSGSGSGSDSEREDEKEEEEEERKEEKKRKSRVGSTAIRTKYAKYKRDIPRDVISFLGGDLSLVDRGDQPSKVYAELLRIIKRRDTLEKAFAKRIRSGLVALPFGFNAEAAIAKMNQNLYGAKQYALCQFVVGRAGPSPAPFSKEVGDKAYAFTASSGPGNDYYKYRDIAAQVYSKGSKSGRGSHPQYSLIPELIKTI